MTVFVDSDVLIEVLRARDLQVLEKWSQLSSSDHLILCSPVSVAELWHGARSKEQITIAELFSTLKCIPIDFEIARRAGDYLRGFHKSHGVELGDALIAASAIQNQATLWTRNRKHYPMRDLKFF